MWAKHRIPSARRVLLAPDPSNLAVGRHNLKLNDMEQRSCRLPTGSEHDRVVILTWPSDNKPHPTRQVTVDGMMRDLEIEKIDLLPDKGARRRGCSERRVSLSLGGFGS